MTIPEEIEELKVKLEKAADGNEKAEVILLLLKKFDSINSIQSQLYIDSLLQLAEKLSSSYYRAWGLYHLAFLHCLKRQDEAALNSAQQSLPLFIQANNNQGIANNYHVIGTVYEHQCNYLLALEYHSKALHLREEIKDMHGIAHSHNNIGVIHELQGDYHQALRNHLQALQIREEMQDKPGIAASYNNIGFIHHTKGNYAEALKNYLRALPVMEEIDYKLGVASLYSNIGLINQQQGNYLVALQNYFQALRIREEMKDASGVAILYNNIGLLHQYQGQHAEALKFFLQAIQIWKEIGDKSGMAHSYINIGIVQEQQKNYTEAIANFTQSLEIATETGDKRAIAESYINIGIIMDRRGDYAGALQNLLKALGLKEEIEDKEGIASCYNNIASVYEKQGNNNEAIINRLLAFQLSEEIGHKELIKQSALLLCNNYKAIGSFGNALKYHEKYLEVQSEVLGEQIQRQLNDLNFKHNMEQKEKEAEIERLRNVELKEALEKLQLEKTRSEQLFQIQLGELKSNALHAQMNPHFVFNSLNAIQQYIWTKNPEEATAYLSRFSKLIRSILDNSRRQFVTLEQDLTTLKYYIELEALRFENKFTHELICDAALTQKAIQLPPMLIQPFVENAIIHGLQPLKTGGKLSVNVQRKSDTLLYITIEDNGVGRQKAGEIKTSKPQTHQSVAVQLTKERLEKMNGEKLNEDAIIITDLYDEQQKPAGTKVEINLPVESPI